MTLFYAAADIGPSERVYLVVDDQGQSITGDVIESNEEDNIAVYTGASPLESLSYEIDEKQ